MNKNCEMLVSDINPFVREVTGDCISGEEETKTLCSYDDILLYFYQGNGTVLVGEKLYYPKAGDVLLIRVGTPYKFVSGNSKLNYILFDFDFTHDGENINFVNLHVSPGTFNKSKIVQKAIIKNVRGINDTVYLENMRMLENRIMLIKNEFLQKEIYFRFIVDSVMRAVITEIARKSNYLEDSMASQVKNDTIDTIIEYVSRNYADEINNKTIGKQFAMHPNYINTLIREKTGYSLHKFLIRKRLSAAMLLLRETDTPVYEISEAVGFKDNTHFICLFRKTVGITPNDYRKRYKSL